MAAIALLVVLLASVAVAEDRLNLEGDSIVGSRELPKVLYIVPWKSARLGALAGGAGSSSLDTSWEALDRDLFRRQVGYYEMLYSANDKESLK
ncbi:MAG: hypothetical protein GXP17_07490 [Gammaproteobacteria bacterium]|nr:hypothetical protein [Gammaproteobacteria bacterium]